MIDRVRQIVPTSWHGLANEISRRIIFAEQIGLIGERSLPAYSGIPEIDGPDCRVWCSRLTENGRFELQFRGHSVGRPRCGTYVEVTGRWHTEPTCTGTCFVPTTPCDMKSGADQ